MGRHAKYSEEDLIAAVAQSVSYAGVMRALGMKPAGGSHAHISRRVKRLGLDTSHFTGMAHGRGRKALNRLSPQEILVVRTPTRGREAPERLRRALRESGIECVCDLCGLTDLWEGFPITLHVDHINGEPLDCRRENLRFLCPNCHSQTPNWAGRTRFRSDGKSGSIA